MKYIICLAITIGFVNLNLRAQSDKELLFETINQLKKEYSKKDFFLDTSLIKVTKSIEEKNLRPKKIDKDFLRSLLRSKGNFDYNIEYVEVSYTKTNKIEKALKESKNVKLKQILNDPLYNKIGLTIDKGLFKNKLMILATQNFVQFDKEFAIEIHEFVEGYKQYNVVLGTASVRNLFFNTCQYDNNFKKLKSPNKSIELKNNNRFEIKVDITDCNGIPMDIEVTDSTGKVLSYIKNR